MYTEEYFLTECDGYACYLRGDNALAQRLQAIWKFLHVCPGMKVLDVGCGRGEIVSQCSRQGILAIGIDYSPAGLRLAQQATTCTEDVSFWIRPGLALSDAKHLPFPEGIFDRVIMSDIIEHLYQNELETALREVRRVLAPGGSLLVHTMPNLWYYRFGYPLFRCVQRLRGIVLPTNPRERFRFSYVHVNEQTPRTLGRTLARVGFSHWHVWLHDYRDYTEYNPVMRHFMKLLTSLPIIQQLFCDDIFAVACK